ncbi:MAG: hypothetical protein WC003_10505 [Terrimicrobiaceae bacterium]
MWKRRGAGIRDYWEDVFFVIGQAGVLFIGQAADEEAQQEVGLVQAFFVIGQVFGDAWVEEHPVNPMVAMQATVRKVTSDFITASR